MTDARLLQDWLVHLADPLGPAGAVPARACDPDQLARLFVLAEMHGVLGAVLQNAPPPANPAAEKVRAAALSRHHAAVGFNLLLRQLAASVIADVNAAGGAALVVKGPTFARLLYPDKALRRFTDIDFLAAGANLALLNDALSARGFLLASGDAERQEWQWYHGERDDLTAEVHGNLVHAPSLRAKMSLAFGDLAPGGDPAEAERPAALLAVAVVHGAVHHFERLIHVVDVLQGARALAGAAEEARFAAIVAATGARLAAATSLAIAGRIFGEPRCTAIARALGPVRHAGIAGRLIDAAVVVSMMDARRARYSWRRSAFRALLKV